MAARKDAEIGIEISGDSKGLTASLNAARSSLNQFAKTTDKQLGAAAKSMTSLEKNATHLKSALQTAFAGFAVGQVLDVAKQVDQFNQLTGRIRLATKATGDFVVVNQQLTDIAKITGANFETTVNVFQRLSLGAKDLGKSNQDVLTLVGLVQKLGAIGGASTTALNAGLLQFGQAMSGGVVRAEEFNSILENLPQLAQVIADGLGVSVGQLRQMMLGGKLLSKDVFEVLIRQSDKINQQFAELPVSLNTSLSALGLSLQQTLAAIDKQTSATSALAKVFDGLGMVLDNMQPQIAGVAEGFRRLWLGWTTLVNGIVGSVAFVATVIMAPIEMAVRGIGYLINQAISQINRITKLTLPKFGVELGSPTNFLAGASQSSFAIAGSEGKQLFAPFRSNIAPPKLSAASFPKFGGGGAAMLGGGGGGGRGGRGGKGGSGRSDIKKDPKQIVADLSNVSAALDASLDSTFKGAEASGRKLLDLFDDQAGALKDLQQQRNSALASLATPMQKYMDQAETLNTQLKDGWLTQGQFNEALKEAQKGLGGVDDKFADLSVGLSRWSGSIENAFVQIFQTGTFSFKSFLGSITEGLARLAVQKLILKPANVAVSGALGSFADAFKFGATSKSGGPGSSAFNLNPQAFGAQGPTAPGRGGLGAGLGASIVSMGMSFFADGGLPPVGKPFVVGEKGPELMMTGTASRVFSNSDSRKMISGGGGNSQPIQVIQNFNLSPIDGPSFEQYLTRSKGRVAALAAEGITLANRRRGQPGPLD